MADLVEFLRSRLDEDQLEAEAAAAFTAGKNWRSHLDYVLGEEGTVATVGPASHATHIARHDPARVLAEVEAKRRIIGLHFIRSGTGGTWDTDPAAVCNECGGLHPCETISILALPYADHADYRDEWRPA